MWDEDDVVRIEDRNDILSLGEIENGADVTAVFHAPQNHDVSLVDVIISHRRAGHDTSIETRVPGGCGIAITAIENARRIRLPCDEEYALHFGS
ncbi:hypothetical protein GKA01_06520 [Gluconobacter kanchanaburiensis NBRC 103587]|uniref:Uncharacterized protein n=1 Tax=Gluconobacter kanchanaburiensis NBRC 103587 TaxID=1307948 RepID=A0A511B4S4_9PROT|nr:hypothetical protein AA103587_0375 [Gluconobacter kanchanaburiensis NBRC 103587]GEK95455.1 hypothetical protein GKA01_06520 [Gluconobacter kanchanaburiensis NBRC 103587]